MRFCDSTQLGAMPGFNHARHDAGFLMEKNMQELKAEQAAKKLRLLEVKLEIAEAQRLYLAEGIPTPAGQRATLWTESQQLTLDLHKINVILRTEKAKAAEFKSREMFILLIEKCKSSGNLHLVNEAKAESMDALQHAGLLEAYQLST